MRAAHILRQTDTLPSNILCLTFTESAAANMQQRLAGIIGPEAYQLAIHTFHSFGTDIINRWRQYFFDGALRRPIDELTQQQLMQQLLSQLPKDHPLASRSAQGFVYLADMLRLVSEFKQSGLTPDELRGVVADNQRIMAGLATEIAQLFSGRISRATVSAFLPLAEHAAALEPSPTGQLPSAITSYAGVLALSIIHAGQEALDTNSTKPITAWKNHWCQKDDQGQTVLKDQLAAERLLASIELYQQYNELLDQQQLFDYDDMILSVLAACQQHPTLQAELQEQFQYIMIDEFQDTNLAQLRLLFTLTGQTTRPNVMVVGDDDQAIFSFQGADVGNIQRFRQHYDHPNIIVLTDNYRSAPVILTAARSIIRQGSDRLETAIDGLSKELTPHVNHQSARVTLQPYQSVLDERAGVARQIKQLITAGTPPEQIAVLARQHQELIGLLPHLAAERIPVAYERHDDVLEHELVQLLELLCRVIIAIADSRHETTNALLPQLLAHPAFGLSAEELWRLSLRAWRQRMVWLEVMLSQPNLAPIAQWLLTQAQAVDQQPLEQQLDNLLGLQSESTEQSPPQTGQWMKQYFLAPDRLDQQPEAYLTTLQTLSTFRTKLRDHYQTQQPTLRQLLEFIDLHHSVGQRLMTVRPAGQTSTNAIQLMTSHKAKGLEFDQVFIIGAIDSTWGFKVRNRQRLIRYPANLPLAPAGASYDERLRLFFVAMTRARQTLTISYSHSDQSQKSTVAAGFLGALDQTPATTTPVAQVNPVSQPTTSEQLQALEHDWRSHLVPQPLPADLHQLLIPLLTDYRLSATHLNTFVDVTIGGPQQFLLYNLLRLPGASTPAASYGTAMHATLAWLHHSYRADGVLPTAEQAADTFCQLLGQQPLPKTELTLLQDQGRRAIIAFVQAKGDTFDANQLAECSFATQSVHLGEARLTGTLDLIDLNPVARTIRVTDYKTGRAARQWRGHNDFQAIKLHKYRQQLLFYQLLCQQSPQYRSYKFRGARLQFVEPSPRGDFVDLEATFSPTELATGSQLIQAVWRCITTGQLPEISHYSPNLQGIQAFEADLIADYQTASD